MKPMFISFDSIDGSGKSTQIEVLNKHIEKKYSVKVVTTREPGGTIVAEILRDIAKYGHKDEELTDETELLLMFAARSQHINHKIKPELKNNSWVITDRFSLSSVAYQGYARGIPLQSINSLKRIVQGTFAPDLTFVLDLPAEVGLKRAKSRDELDRIELAGLEFFERARDGFLTVANENPDDHLIIDALPSVDEVSKAIIEAFDKWIENKMETGKRNE